LGKQGTRECSARKIVNGLGYRTKKQTVFRKIAAFVEKYKGGGGEL